MRHFLYTKQHGQLQSMTVLSVDSKEIISQTVECFYYSKYAF